MYMDNTAASIVLHPSSPWEVEMAGRYVDRVAGDEAPLIKDALGLPA